MYRSAIAIEDLDNYSICVLTEIGIRKMKFQEDIEENLVYVNTIKPLSMDEYKIEQGQCVRYLPVNIVPKFTINKI